MDTAEPAGNWRLLDVTPVTNITDRIGGVAERKREDDKTQSVPRANASIHRDCGIRPFLFTDLDTYRDLYNCTLLN